MSLAVAGLTPGLYLLWKNVVEAPLVAVMLSVVLLLVAGRLAVQYRLGQLRRRGHARSTLLVVGVDEDVTALAARLRRAPELGWHIAGICTPTGMGPDGRTTVADVPVLGDLDSVAAVALARQFDAVAVCPAPGWTSVRLQQLARDLDCSRSALLVHPRLGIRKGPRADAVTVGGLPLLKLVHPRLSGVRRILKEMTDRAVALLLLLFVAPILIGCALVVRRDGGPALRREIRVGEEGRPVSLLMFRVTAVDTGSVTPVGRVLRRWCLDGLPQLFNVLGGSMALVGPRPSRPSEVPRCAWHEYNRLPVRPGMTGLWQIAGTDKLSWEQAALLDLRYAEMWTPLLDARILLRTVGVVLRAGAAR